ncbi:hypothetical protein ABPG72_000296 [Tetrahymena utriculariae]
MIQRQSQFETPKLDRTQYSINFMVLKSQNSISPRKSQSILKKQMTYQQLLMSRVESQILDEELEITLENAWKILKKDPQVRTDKEHNCVYEIISEFEIFKQYIEEGNKDLIRIISVKLVGYECKKDQVALSSNSDGNFLHIILQGEVSIYENNQASNREQMKAQFIRKQSQGQSINLNHIIFQRPFTDIAISDSNTLIAKLDKKIFRKYLQQIEEEKVDHEISFLQSIDLFSQLDKDEFKDVLLNLDIQKLSLNQILYSSYSQATAFYIIKSGQIGIYKENSVSKIKKLNKQLKFIEENEKDIDKISNFQQEKQIGKRNLLHQSTLFELHDSNFYISLKSTHTKVQELNTFDFFGYEEILSNKVIKFTINFDIKQILFQKTDHAAMCLQDNTILYIFRSSYFIKQLLKKKCFEKTILQKRFTQKLENKQQQNLSIQFEQDLKLGLRVIENHSPNKSSFLQEISLNDSTLNNTRNIFVRKQKKSQSVNLIQNQKEFLSPSKISASNKNILDQQGNIANKKMPISQSFYLNDSQQNEAKDVLQNNGFVMRQQERIDAYIQKQNQSHKLNLSSLNIPFFKSDSSVKNPKYILSHSQVLENDLEDKQKSKNEISFTKTEDSQRRKKKKKTQLYLQQDQFNEFDSTLKQSQSLNYLQQKQKTELSIQQDEKESNQQSAIASNKNTNPFTNSKNIFSDPFLALSQRQLQIQTNLSPKKNGSLSHMQMMSYQTNPKQYISQNKIQNFNIMSLQKISNI